MARLDAFGERYGAFRCASAIPPGWIGEWLRSAHPRKAPAASWRRRSRGSELL